MAPASVGAVIHSDEVGGNQANGLKRVQVGHGRVGIGHEGFDCVNQRIDARTRRQIRRHGRQRRRIDQGHIGHDCFANDGDLDSFLPVGDDGELGNVGGSAAGRGDANQRGRRHGHLIDPLKFEDVAPVGADNADALGAVHRAAAAHCDDHITA